ncbi:1-(5-phosphoribosyl)-5-[(5-phosphoribosylamino)methylideneamino]imidazole-4-carboxamide isomerase [Kytococcus sp. Marseille-QA3725]
MTARDETTRRVPSREAAAADRGPAGGFTCYPALDIREGQVVRLRQGDYDQQTSYALDPVEQAGRYAAAGAQWLHLVDLDAARTGGWTLAGLVQRIVAETGLRVQTGGGVRSREDVEAMLGAGATRVVVGSLAVTRPEDVRDWVPELGPERLTVALDARQVGTRTTGDEGEGARWELPTRGWTQDSGVDLAALLQGYSAAGLRHVLATDISRDGMMTGPGLALYDHLRGLAPGLDVQASGGIRDVADVEAVRARGCAGAVLGRSLLEGTIELAELKELVR